MEAFSFPCRKAKSNLIYSFFLPGQSLSHPPSTRKAKPLRGAAQPCGFPPGAIPSGHQKKRKTQQGVRKELSSAKGVLMMKNYNMTTKTDAEMLARLLNLPEKALQSHTLQEVMTSPMAIKGVGEKSTEKLMMLNELSRRWSMETNPVDTIHGPEDVAHYLWPRYRDEMREHFVLVLLNTKNHIIATPVVSIGSLSASVVHPREVFKEAILYSAACMILVHNHPSGDPTPSREDKAVTERLVKCGKLMDIPVLDHVILGRYHFFSFKEKGLMNN